MGKTITPPISANTINEAQYSAVPPSDTPRSSLAVWRKEKKLITIYMSMKLAARVTLKSIDLSMLSVVDDWF